MEKSDVLLVTTPKAGWKLVEAICMFPMRLMEALPLQVL